MSKRQKHTTFLKTLILHGNAEERLQLQDRINRAERDEVCAWRALWLVTLLAVFSCCGVLYSAVLIPEFFQSSTHLVVKIFCGLGLASLICAIAFMFFWLWCRGVLNRVHEDCRRFIMAILEPGARTNHSRFFPAANEEQKNGKQEAVERKEIAVARIPTHPTYAQLFSLRRSA